MPMTMATFPCENCKLSGIDRVRVHPSDHAPMVPMRALGIQQDDSSFGGYYAFLSFLDVVGESLEVFYSVCTEGGGGASRKRRC